MGFLKPFLIFSILGCAGVLSLLPMTLALARKLLSEQPEMGLGEMRLGLLLLANPGILLLIGAAVGTALADRVGLRSILLDVARGRAVVLPDWRDFALGIGLGLAVAILILALQSGLRTAGWALPVEPEGGPSGEPLVAARISALLYGGMTEEIMVRFGLMTLLVWMLAMVFRIEDAAGAPVVVWSAILLTAIVFGLGHLPLAANIAPLTAATIAIVVVLNAISGVAYGWLYWRVCLEIAMVAHMATHVGFWTFGPLFSALGERLGPGS